MEAFEKQRSYQPISEAYAGRSIFVTGATGFLGKVFVEKILYSCPKISKIYLLVREKKNIDADERIKKMLEMPVFNRIRNERPDDLKKLIPVYGDIAYPKLGMKPEDEEMLIKTVSMVFHFAATVRFTEPLEIAFNINFKGTKRILELCQKIINIKAAISAFEKYNISLLFLDETPVPYEVTYYRPMTAVTTYHQAFIYVSTAYSNADEDYIEEILYPPPVPLEEAEELEKRTTFSQEETMKLLNLSRKPNTYTFTKALAENYVSKYHGNVPSAIIRPAIVASSKAEPLVGWLENWFGATGVVFLSAEGFNRVMFSNYNNLIDLIPVDYVANLAIVAGAKCESSREVPIYNSCTSSKNPITMGKFFELSTMTSLDRIQWFSWMSKTLFTESEWIFKIVTILQTIPAMVLDGYLYVIGKQTKYVKSQKTAVRFRDSVVYFTTRSWRISAELTCALFASLSKTDQKCFGFDPTSIDWEEFIPNYMDGVRRYLLKKP